jgi:nucleoside phosphorylase
MTRAHKDYTVAIVSALWFETAACLGMLDEPHPRLRAKPGDNNSYKLGRLAGHNVVLVCLPGTTGNTAASNTSTNLLRTFPEIKTVLLVGIGGGVAGRDKKVILERDLRLGDIVVGMPSNKTGHGIVEYDLGRETENGFERKGFLTPSPPLLRSIATTMRMDTSLPSRLAEHIKNMDDDEDEFQRPAADTDVVFVADEAVSRPPRKRPDRPKIHYGLIATGDTVVKSSESQKKFVDRLAQEGDVLCFEMEAAGVATTTACFVIRGICDYADAHKNKVWQNYAAAAAAAYAKELLENLDPVVVEEEAAGSNPIVQSAEQSRQTHDQGSMLGGATNITQGKGYVINGGSHTFGDVTFN